MRIAIISDIHSNLEALTEVLRVADQQKVDRMVSLGDIVGYGASLAVLGIMNIFGLLLIPAHLVTVALQCRRLRGVVLPPLSFVPPGSMYATALSGRSLTSLLDMAASPDRR